MDNKKYLMIIGKVDNRFKAYVYKDLTIEQGNKILKKRYRDNIILFYKFYNSGGAIDLINDMNAQVKGKIDINVF